MAWQSVCARPIDEGSVILLAGQVLSRERVPLVAVGAATAGSGCATSAPLVARTPSGDGRFACRSVSTCIGKCSAQLYAAPATDFDDGGDL